MHISQLSQPVQRAPRRVDMKRKILYSRQIRLVNGANNRGISSFLWGQSDQYRYSLFRGKSSFNPLAMYSSQVLQSWS